MTNLIMHKQSVRYPELTVVKYKNKVFYDNLWHTDSALLESRGRVIDSNGNTVINPFTKVFNRNEQGTDIDRDSECIAARKINGFMAGATFVPCVGKVVVSTTGSLDSDFVKLAEQWLNDDIKRKIETAARLIKKSHTYLFEICDPSDKHIITEEYGPYLLGIRKVNSTTPYHTDYHNEVWLDQVADHLNCYRPDWFPARFSDIVQLSKSCTHEGYMVYEQSGNKTTLKLKSPHYLCLKLLARCKDVLKLDKKRVDEEFYPLIAFIEKHIGWFNTLGEQEKLEFMRQFIIGTKVYEACYGK